MSEEIHSQLLAFIGEAFGRKEHRQATKLKLFYCPPHSREEEMRSWERHERAELFERLDLTEALIREIIEICETHADTQGVGRHKYKIRIDEALGGKVFHQFAMKPSFDPSTALVPSGGGGDGGGGNIGDAALSVLSANNQTLMRINQQTHESTFRALANMTDDLREENMELRIENRSLRKQVDELESTKMDREYQFAMAAEKSARSNKATEKLLQLGSVVIAKITGTAKELGAPDGLTMLLTDFGKSLRQDQLQKFMTVLDQSQIAMFFQIMEMVQPKPAANQGGGTGGGPPPNTTPPSPPATPAAPSAPPAAAPARAAAGG